MPRNFKQVISGNLYTILFTAIFIVYIFNLFIDVMEIDAAQYALISMEMSWTKSFLQVYQQGQDYLDKPPLLFWLSSLSMLLLGISTFAYKLPSVLIAILGIYSTYRFAKHFYSKETARLAALVLASSQALFLITNDIRTDTNLLGLTMFSVWQLSAYLKSKKWKNLLLTGIGIGGAMMAKGPIALIIPAAAFGLDFLLKREWKNIFKPQWLLLLLIIASTLIPMSYGLYSQFDLHPEKTVYGLEGPSGLRFFFWTQSFGRITGEIYWDNDAGYFYFLHTILWDFQPWVSLFIPALIIRFRKLILKKFKAQKNEEYASFGGFILVFIALSLSSYKLPHYIFVLFPFASILVADFIYQLKEKVCARVAKVQFGIMHIFWVLMPINFIFIFPPKNAILPALLFLLFIITWKAFLSLKRKAQQTYIPTIITAFSFNLLMATNFYPNLLTYQSTSQAGKMVDENTIPNDKFYHFERSSYSLDFYAKRITPSARISEIDKLENGSWIFTDEQGLKKLNENNIRFVLIKSFPKFHVTALDIEFLWQETRHKRLEKEYLVKIL